MRASRFVPGGAISHLQSRGETLKEPSKTRHAGGPPIRVPDCLLPLVEQGVISEVVRPLLSGKEAQIYLVRVGDDLRVAKAYKNAQHRSFKHRSQYTEGRKVRNTRDQRAMAKGSRYGKSRDEAAWKATEVDVIYRLRDAGVRVPEPFIYIDGVLVMELVTDADGHPAPRLGDIRCSPDEAQRVFDQLLRETVKMLCVGIVHGDLSDFNVLMAADGPVIIDFPQAISAAGNQNAERILVRDVNNLNSFLARHVPRTRRLPYGQEMWAVYQRSELTPDYELSGKFTPAPQKTTTKSLLDEIAEIEREARDRRRTLGLEPKESTYVYNPVTTEELEKFAQTKKTSQQPSGGKRRRRRKKAGAGAGQGGGSASAGSRNQNATRSEAPKGGGRRRGNAPKQANADSGRAQFRGGNQGSRKGKRSGSAPKVEYTSRSRRGGPG